MDISGWEKNQSFPYGGYGQNNDQPGPLETIRNLNQQAGETILNIGGQVLDTYDRVEQEILPARRPAIQAASSWVDNNLTSLLKKWSVTEPYAQVSGDVAGAVTDLGLEIFTPGLEETVAGALTLGAVASPFDGPFGDAIGVASTGGLYSKGVTTRAIKSIPDFKRILDGVFNGSWKIIDGKRVFVTPEGIPIPQSDLNPNVMMSKGDNYVQGNLPLERFQTVPYQRSVVSKMIPFGMKDGVFRLDAFDATKSIYKGDKKQRAMLEAFLSPDRLAGSFDGFGKANRPGFAAKWADFLKARGLDPVGDIQIHHINPLHDSIHLFDGVKFNSKEYWDVIETLIQGNARSGIIHRGDDVNNLMMTLGKGKVPTTPHGIAHKYLSTQTPTFFSKAELKRMSNPKGVTDEFGKFWKPGEYRLYKAEKWAEIVVKSEQVILEAHKQWGLLNPEIAKKLSFDELVDTLSTYTDQGYSKLLSPEYQLPDFNRIITQIANDKGLKGPIFQLKSKPRNLVKEQKDADLIREGLDIEDAARADRNLRKMRNPKPNPNPGQTELDL